MGRHFKQDFARLGPKVWARFLKRHFGCADLTPLNAQLTLPITPGERFEFGEDPHPLPARFAPKAFERAYNHGRTPDGLYTTEPYSPDPISGPKFNLYSRVTQRVPESRYWLLKEWEPYLQATPPHIDVTSTLLRHLLSDLELVYLARLETYAWELTDHVSIGEAEANTLSALPECSLPEIISLTYALYHLSVWHEPRQTTASGLSERIAGPCRTIAEAFCRSLAGIGLDDGKAIGEALADRMYYTSFVIGENGARSMRTQQGPLLNDLSHYLVLVPDTEQTRKARLTLLEAYDLTGPPNVLELDRRLRPLTTNQTPEQAVAVLRDACADLKAQLVGRALGRLSCYRDKIAEPFRAESRTAQVYRAQTPHGLAQ